MNFDKLTDFLDFMVDEKGIPGNDTIVLQGHDTIYRHFHGYSDRENKIPMNGRELTNLYSSSKLITCVSALMLVERGRLGLNDLLSDYLPEFKQMYVKKGETFRQIIVPAQNPIRIKHLFTMTAGFNYDLDTPAIKRAVADTDGRAPTLAVIRALATQPLEYEPGTHWCYSLAHDVLAAVVEVVSGMRFRDYVQKYIFNPLEMNESTFERTPEIMSRVMQQYYMDSPDKPIRPVGPDFNEYVLGPEYDSGGAGIISSVDDYAKFMSMLACGGVAKNGTRIIGSNTIEAMRTNWLNEEQLYDKSVFDGLIHTVGYGLGVRVNISRANGEELTPVGCFGWGGAAGIQIIIDPDRQISMFYEQHVRNYTAFLYREKLANVLYSCLD